MTVDRVFRRCAISSGDSQQMEWRELHGHKPFEQSAPHSSESHHTFPVPNEVGKGLSLAVHSAVICGIFSYIGCRRIFFLDACLASIEEHSNRL